MKGKGKSKKPVISAKQIENCILLIRGQKVMLDRDLAELYGVATKRLNEQVKRNLRRFPEDFMFRLTSEEKAEVVANCDHLNKLKFSRTLPYTFTEQGVAMLSTVLNSDRAILVNVEIMRAFVRLRQMLAAHGELARKLSQLEGRIAGHDEEIQAIFEAIRQLMEPPPDDPKPKIGFHVRERPVRYAARKKK